MTVRLLVLTLAFLPALALATDAPPSAPASVPAATATPPGQPDLAARLDALAPLFRSPPPAVPPSLLPQDGDACAIELATVALLYRHDANQWRDRFFALLVIDDYAARARKEYNLVGGDAVAGIINGALAAVPGVEDERMQAVVAFCELRRTQPFVMTRKGGMIALSRVARAMVLGGLLEDTGEDPMAMTNAIDTHTRSQHPGLELPWEKPLE